MAKILLVDDDRDLVDLIGFALTRAGFNVLPAHDTQTALKLLEDQKPDLAVLDVNLGSENGFDLLKDLRASTNVPVIMLTGRDAEEDKVFGLERGADDYLTKPFGHRELIARIRAHLRRQGVSTTEEPARVQLQVGPITLNLARHTVHKDGKPVELSVTEFRLLHYLMLNAEVVVSSRDILRQVWDDNDPGGSDVVRITVHRLRRKLEDDPNQPRLLQTVPGVGIMLTASPD
jgi:DNA-binding response OmpR family regulator